MKESDQRGGGGVEAGSVVSAVLPRYEVCGVPPACTVPTKRRTAYCSVKRNVCADIKVHNNKTFLSLSN